MGVIYKKHINLSHGAMQIMIRLYIFIYILSIKLTFVHWPTVSHSLIEVQNINFLWKKVYWLYIIILNIINVLVYTFILIEMIFKKIYKLQ